MSESMGGTFGQRAVDPAESLKRVDPMDRDSSDRERRSREDFDQEKRREHAPLPPGEDRVEISEAALRALRETAQGDTLPPIDPPRPAE